MENIFIHKDSFVSYVWRCESNGPKLYIDYETVWTVQMCGLCNPCTALITLLHTPVHSLNLSMAAPTQAPQNVQVTAENSTTVRVSWDEVPASSVNGQLQKFLVMKIDRIFLFFALAFRVWKFCFHQEKSSYF